MTLRCLALCKKPLLNATLRLFLSVTIAIALTNCADNVKPPINSQEHLAPATTQPTSLAVQDAEKYLEAMKAIDKSNYRFAEKTLVKLRKRNPNVTGVWANLAIAQFKQGLNEQAEKSALRANKLNPKDAEIYNLLGLIFVELGRFPLADKHYKNAINLNKSYADAHYNIALLYDIYFQDIPAAYIHYKRYLELIDFKDKETSDWVEQLKYSLDRES